MPQGAERVQVEVEHLSRFSGFVNDAHRRFSCGRVRGKFLAVLAPALPADERQRLEDLRALDVLDSEKEPAFERITSLAATLFDVPIAVVSLVDEARQWFKSVRGLDVTETPRNISFCGHAILQPSPFEVTNALEDPRFFDNPLVTGTPHIRFYAGAPLTTPRGHRVGTLCLLDRRPRNLTHLQKQVLEDLAGMVVSELELRATRRDKIREAAELQALLSAFPTAVIVIGDDDVLRFTNHGLDVLLGYEPGELVGHNYLEIVHPDEQKASLSVAKAARGPLGGPREIHRKMVRKNGEPVNVEGAIGRLNWAGQPAIVVAMRDVTAELKKNEQRELIRAQVTAQLNLLLQAFDVLPNGIVLFDPQFRCVYANKALGDMLGLEPSAVLGWTPEDAAHHVMSLTSGNVRESIIPNAWRQPGQDKNTQVFALMQPQPRVVRRSLHTLSSSTHPHLALWTDITHEATELARSEEEASTDQLTGLPNRRAATAKLTRALSNGGQVAIALFDIDHFKRINDTWGHGAGDDVLRVVGKALASCAREGDLVARWGGEEFLGVLRGTLDGARVFAERARAAVAGLTTGVGQVTVSAGVAQGVAGSDPFNAADEKLYEAKRSGRNRVCG
ncbi:MAG: diguanylate cyclase [Polyangiales bacterium]